MPDAERVLAFLRSLPIVSGLRAGEHFEPLEFQEQFVRNVYRTGDDGGRIVRLAALSLGRGNGKSALLAGLSLAHLLGPMAEPHGECYAAALDREQAGVLYRMTVAYIEATPWMAARVNIRDWHKEITDEQTRSIWRALTSDARKAHGLAPSFWIADEAAQWRSRELWDNLATGMGKRAHDLSSTRDLCALALWFPDEGKLLAWHFVPSDTIGERVERDNPNRSGRNDHGYRNPTPGN